MRQCPGCNQLVGMSDDVIANGDATYHRDCYRKLAEESVAEGPDALDRIADALEVIAAKYQNDPKSVPWLYNRLANVDYNPRADAEKR